MGIDNPESIYHSTSTRNPAKRLAEVKRLKAAISIEIQRIQTELRSMHSGPAAGASVIYATASMYVDAVGNRWQHLQNPPTYLEQLVRLIVELRKAESENDSVAVAELLIIPRMAEPVSTEANRVLAIVATAAVVSAAIVAGTLFSNNNLIGAGGGAAFLGPICLIDWLLTR